MEFNQWMEQELASLMEYNLNSWTRRATLMGEGLKDHKTTQILAEYHNRTSLGKATIDFNRCDKWKEQMLIITAWNKASPLLSHHEQA